MSTMDVRFYQRLNDNEIYQNGGIVNTGGGIMKLHIYTNFEPKESIMLDPYTLRDDENNQYSEYEYPEAPQKFKIELQLEELQKEVEKQKRKIKKLERRN